MPRLVLCRFHVYAATLLQFTTRAAFFADCLRSATRRVGCCGLRWLVLVSWLGSTVTHARILRFTHTSRFILRWFTVTRLVHVCGLVTPLHFGYTHTTFGCTFLPHLYLDCVLAVVAVWIWFTVTTHTHTHTPHTVALLGYITCILVLRSTAGCRTVVGYLRLHFAHAYRCVLAAVTRTPFTDFGLHGCYRVYRSLPHVTHYVGSVGSPRSATVIYTFTLVTWLILRLLPFAGYGSPTRCGYTFTCYGCLSFLGLRSVLVHVRTVCHARLRARTAAVWVAAVRFAPRLDFITVTYTHTFTTACGYGSCGLVHHTTLDYGYGSHYHGLPRSPHLRGWFTFAGLFTYHAVLGLRFVYVYSSSSAGYGYPSSRFHYIARLPTPVTVPRVPGYRTLPGLVLRFYGLPQLPADYGLRFWRGFCGLRFTFGHTVTARFTWLPRSAGFYRFCRLPLRVTRLHTLVTHGYVAVAFYVAGCTVTVMRLYVAFGYSCWFIPALVTFTHTYTLRFPFTFLPAGYGCYLPVAPRSVCRLPHAFRFCRTRFYRVVTVTVDLHITVVHVLPLPRLHCRFTGWFTFGLVGLGYG